MKDFNGEKIFCLEYDKETLKDMVIEKQEEIERLNNIIKEAIEYLKEKAIYDVDMKEFCRDLYYYDCLDLLNILKGDKND